jgi:SAM-dependent methyltransferase
MRLKASGRIVGRVLDYGCGKGYDAQHLCADSYDPHFQPNMPVGTFDTILCTFVLNTIPSPEERESIVSDVLGRLNDGGRAYFTVRTDKARLNGRTSRGTWQGLVVMDAPIVAKGSGFVTYCKGYHNGIS